MISKKKTVTKKKATGSARKGVKRGTAAKGAARGVMAKASARGAKTARAKTA